MLAHKNPKTALCVEPRNASESAHRDVFKTAVFRPVLVAKPPSKRKEHNWSQETGAFPHKLRSRYMHTKKYVQSLNDEG